MPALIAVLYVAIVAGLAAGFGAVTVRPSRETLRAGLAGMGLVVLVAGLIALFAVTLR